ncbi:MAG: zinc-ribbon domain-containing protein [Candidatus Omnitrophica bacterium]|nr:zinc-ribbon domain-containing protein [Candidatus Omnitrophota bacterium]
MPKKASPLNNLKLLNPALAKQWHPVQNGSLTPCDVLPNSNMKAWWLCPYGHEWRVSVADRNTGKGCPYCKGRYLTLQNCLAAQNPDLLKQWHPTRNGSLTACDVQPGSHKKVWWLCQYGHEWQSEIRERTNGQGCPFCSHHRVTFPTSLAVRNPVLAGQWHPTKNASLTPYDVLPNSHKKAWWQCPRGHVWKANIGNRHLGRNCPYCVNQRVHQENCLAAWNPELAGQWHPTRNGSLTPSDVLPNSNKRVWWLYPCGHELEASIYSRNKGSGCFLCNTQLVSYCKSLLFKNSKLVGEWHPIRNGSLNPSHIGFKSTRIVYWICEFKHVWSETVKKRMIDEGCPMCISKNA